MIVPALPMHQYDDTPMMVSVLYWKKKKIIVFFMTVGSNLFLENIRLVQSPPNCVVAIKT